MLWVALAVGALLAGKCLSFVSTLAEPARKWRKIAQTRRPIPIRPA